MGAPEPDVLEGLSPARLIPATKTGLKEQEQRATSALLAVMSIVPSFGHAVLKYLHALKGTITTFVEPHFESDTGGTDIPDGLVLVRRGKTNVPFCSLRPEGRYGAYLVIGAVYIVTQPRIAAGLGE